MAAALLQLTSSDDPEANLAALLPMLRRARAEGAALALTPEVTNCVSASRSRQAEVLCDEAEDPTLAAVRDLAAETGLWVVLGSLALKPAGEQRFVNRAFLIDGSGAIRARYDKIHMFDVEIGGTESYRESEGYRPGARAVLAQTPWGRIGLTICYDVRFPALYRRLAEAGAEILAVPAAFTVPTGRAHWEILLRARAIETGCFVLAPAQTGTHPASRGRSRQTWGQSLAVAPWGEVIADAGSDPGITHLSLDLAEVARARSRVPALANACDFEGP
ncbi:MAG: carbon-nitrogen hydrolase family protein [Pikeienuella sp.]